MLDYYSFPKASIVRVPPHPAHQVPGHPLNNISLGCPEQLLSRYWRRARLDLDPAQPEWFLDPDDKQWSELLPFLQVLALYDDKPHRPQQAIEQDAERQRRQEANLLYWQRVRALPGGDDPLWQYSSHGEDQPDSEADDDRFKLWDWSQPELEPWYPRRVLRARYGTTSLIEYARRNGVER